MCLMLSKIEQLYSQPLRNTPAAAAVTDTIVAAVVVVAVADADADAVDTHIMHLRR
jgi:hypothetical protein